MLLLEISLTLIGFIALSLSMKRHLLQTQSLRLQAQHKNNAKQQMWFFRVVGSFCLLLSASFCIANHNIAVGLVFWLGLMTLTALLQSLLLSYRPSWVIPIGLVALTLSALTGISIASA